MSVAAVAGKAGGTGLFLVGVPGTLYLTKDYTLLYQIERNVIDQTGNLDVTEGSGDSEATVKDAASNTKWTCTIKASIVDETGNVVTPSGTGIKSKLKKYLEKQLPSSDTTGTPASEIRKNNKKQLVWDCSKDRKATSGESITTELKVNVVKKNSNGEKWFISLFGSEVELTDS